MRQFYTFLIIISAFSLNAQQDIFWRGNPDGADSGDWFGDNGCNEIGSSQSQWFYPGFGGNPARDQPNCFDGSTSNHYVNFDNNHETTMTVSQNVSICRLFFQASATSSRTISNNTITIANSNGNTPKIENLSSTLHTINSNLALDFSSGEINPVNGNLLITGTINNNGYFIDVYGNNGNTLTLDGVVSGNGGLALKQNSTLILSENNTYTGGTFVEAGTLILRGDLADSDVTVQSGATLQVDSDVTIKSLTVNSGGNVVINAGEGLTITNNLVNNNSITLNSTSSTYSSLIVGGMYSGSGAATYNRYTAQVGPTGTNDLVSSPVSGLQLGTFLTSNSSALAQNGSGPTVYAFAPFDNANDYANASQHYVNFDSNTATTTALTSGEGYRAGTVNGETLAFTGGITTGDVTLASFGVGASTSYGHWNLIGNPYPSYILLSEFLTQNTTKFDTNSAGVYGYGGDISSNGWTQWGQAFSDANPGTLMAPGQGFFVASNGTNTATALFTNAMRSTGNSDDFINRNSSPHVGLVELSMNSSTANFSTDIYFNTNASQGLDIGYDMSLFGGSAPAFALYSHLVQDNNGVPMGVQTLGGNDLDNVTIPLGVNANQGEQLTFSITNSDLSPGINIYLDDTVAGSSTLLNSGDYIVTPTTNLTGTGRFYIRFANSVLSTPEHAFNDVSIYANQSNRTINIAGQLTNDSSVNIYDIQGRLMVSKPLNTESNLQVINANTFHTGIYLVQLSNGIITRTEKIILK